MTASEELPIEGPVDVVVVDDHRLLGESLSVALEAHGLRTALPELGVRDALVAHVVALRPRLVLLDLDLGGDVGDGGTLVRPWVEAGLRVLLVTASDDVEQIARAVELGAVGAVAKSRPFRELLDTVVTAARGVEVLTPFARLALVDEARRRRTEREEALAPFSSLTAREQQVLLNLTEGRTVTAIARRSVVSEATVRSQVRAILTKLGVRSQLEAVVAAQRSGWSSSG